MYVYSRLDLSTEIIKKKRKRKRKRKNSAIN